MMMGNKLSYNRDDGILFILLSSMAAGSLSGIWQLPRTFTILFFFVLLSQYKSTKVLARVLRFFVFWLSWAALSLIWTSDFSNGITQSILLITNFLFFFEIVYFAGRSSNMQAVFSVGWSAAFLITAVIGVWEILTDNHLYLSRFGSDAYMIADGQYIMRHYAAATFVNFNSYVTFICYCVPFLFYGYFLFSRFYMKLLSLLLLSAGIFILFMNVSRGGLLALALQFCFFFLPLMSRKGTKGTIVGLLLLFAALLYVFWDEISVYIMIRSMGTSSFEDEPRYDIWMRALKCFWPTLGIGTGVGSIMTSMKAVSGSDDVIVPHNAVLEILVQYGVVICLLCIRFVVKIFRARRYVGDKYTKAFINSSILSLIAILIIDSSYLISPAFWAFFASLFCIANKSVLIKDHLCIR